MGESSPILLYRKEIKAFCDRWKIAEFSVFGSALRDDFDDDSDVDVLVTLNPELKNTLFDMAAMKADLEIIFGREVDLVSRRGLERSRNHFRRDAILKSARVIQAAG